MIPHSCKYFGINLHKITWVNMGLTSENRALLANARWCLGCTTSNSKSRTVGKTREAWDGIISELCLVYSVVEVNIKKTREWIQSLSLQTWSTNCAHLCLSTCVCTYVLSSTATVTGTVAVSWRQKQQKQMSSCAKQSLFHESSRNAVGGWPFLAAFS